MFLIGFKDISKGEIFKKTYKKEGSVQKSRIFQHKNKSENKAYEAEYLLSKDKRYRNRVVGNHLC